MICYRSMKHHEALAKARRKSAVREVLNAVADAVAWFTFIATMVALLIVGTV